MSGTEKKEQTSGSASSPAETVKTRIFEKIDDYRRYDFSEHEVVALSIFFDLAQEYEDIDLLYNLSVQLLDALFGMPAEYYVYEHGKHCALCTRPVRDDGWLLSSDDVQSSIFELADRLCFPVRGKFINSTEGTTPKRDILGVMVLYPPAPLAEHKVLYYKKYANRVGFALHNMMLARKNEAHITFVRNLVQDIGHNVLGPNMYFKYLITKLEGSIVENGAQIKERYPDDAALASKHFEILSLVHEVQQHFSHSSLFLESLLREGHFVQGSYMLRPSKIDLVERVVRPQFQRYTTLLTARGIKAELDVLVPNDLQVEADVGLISQVVDNLFSNALKYSAPVAPGQSPSMRCVVRSEDDFSLKKGVLVEVMTSGITISEEDQKGLFKKYFRASTTANIPGTGKGLFFVNEIVCKHHGKAGYRPIPNGNVFYFSLPAVQEQE